MTTQMILNRYKTVLTHFAGDFGPVNLSGISYDLPEYIEQAEVETLDTCPELKELNVQLRKRFDTLFDLKLRLSTQERNTDPVVKEIVGKMDDMAFHTDHLHQVANHPLVSLMVSYMAMLAGYSSNEPDYYIRWAEAKHKAEKRVIELEAIVNV
jgi:hypothetical protein